jgi:hypothetical protein
MKIKLGSSLKSNTQYVPGPGNYDSSLKNKRDSPKFGFGSSTRDGGVNKKLSVPGPGAYRLKSSIGDVPEYAIGGRKDEHKYV